MWRRRWWLWRWMIIPIEGRQEDAADCLNLHWNNTKHWLRYHVIERPCWLAQSSTTDTASRVSATSAIAASSSRSSSSSKNPSYLSYPSTRQASSAPLQLLDPSKLGMSIEHIVSQLKDNFVLATAGSAADSTADTATDGQEAFTAAARTMLMTHSGSATVSFNASSNNSQSSSSIKYAPSTLTRIVSDAKSLAERWAKMIRWSTLSCC